MVAPRNFWGKIEKLGEGVWGVWWSFYRFFALDLKLFTNLRAPRLNN